MAAMDIFVRNNIPSIRSQTQASLNIPDYFKSNDDIHWSWSHIKEEFRIKESEDLFYKYQARLQHSLLVLMIILNLIQSTCAVIVYFVIAKDLQAVSVTLLLRGISMIMYTVFLCVSHKELWFRPDPSRIIVSIFLLISMTLTTHGSIIYKLSHTDQCERGVRPTYYVILLIYVMLPFPRKWHCVVAGVVFTTLELTFVSICEEINTTSITKQFFPYMFASELTFYLVGGIVGVCVRFLTELTNRRAFLDRRAYIEAKRKMNIDKKQQERLLLSVIPQHIMDQVKNNIRKVITSLDKRVFNRRPFNQLFIETYLDVSILYADIVNSVQLAIHLPAFELVKTLDQLFARFDDSAEATGCFRVKLIGDCYYCVSGMPTSDRRHADNCVKMGLEMIDIIRHVREEHSVDVDMRIGIHSGRVMCGLLGLCKWQYDIWSKDVLIASRMEQTGIPGHVHITDATFMKLREQYHPLIKGNAHLTDSFLQGEHVENTYLIKRPSSATPISRPRRNSMYAVKEVVNGSPAAVVTRQYRISQSGLSLGIPRVIGDYSLKQYRQLVSDINSDMDGEIERMALSKKDQWCNPESINPLLLTFEDRKLESEYRNKPDPLFKYYMLCALVIFCGTTLIHILAIPWNPFLLVIFTLAFILIVFGNCFIWMAHILSFSKQAKRLRRVSIIINNWQDILIKTSRRVNRSFRVRLAIWFLTSSLLLAVAMLGLDDCGGNQETALNRTNVNVTSTEYSTSVTSLYRHHHQHHNPESRDRLSCHDPWYFTFSAVLAMTSTSVFLKVHYCLKLVMHITGATIFCYLIAHLESGVFLAGERHFADWKHFNDPLLSHCYFVVSFALTLHLLDRQVEYMSRVNFLSERKVRGEQEEAEIMCQVNRALLINILPIHVAKKYLERDDSEADHLYYEEYKSVAVMFASMPEYTNFYTENLINEQGLKCLQLLNEIICDFDELFYITAFRKVTKIKTVGSTYMAATGLLPDRDSIEGYQGMDEPTCVVTMVQFAAAMMEKLQQMNKDAQQDLRLRIGIAIGPVIAGVVGAVKPQYDIWGDTVNTASRMDSSGVVGRIQVTEEAARLLIEAQEENPFELECRGEQEIKGKGKLTTYLVVTPFDGSHLETTRL